MEITDDEVEWALVHRLKVLLEEDEHPAYEVTRTYSLFIGTLCWATQRLRTKSSDIRSADVDKTGHERDKVAHKLGVRLSTQRVDHAPWSVHIAPTERIAAIASLAATIVVPSPSEFEGHSALDFLVALRDAVAHGDARNIKAFHVNVPGPTLVGFTFHCCDRDKTWMGQITLLEQDMRRLAITLAEEFCNGIRRSERNRRKNSFTSDANALREAS